MADREFDGMEHLTGLGGVRGLCQKLGTHPVNGLKNNESDLVRRREVFGENVMSVKPAKTYLQLIYAALQDFIVIILMISAFVRASAVDGRVTLKGDRSAALRGMTGNGDGDQFFPGQRWDLTYVSRLQAVKLELAILVTHFQQEI
jgi:hypothetical protein